GNTYMHTTIGGVDPDTGEDASNPVSYMTLAALGRMKLHDPTISLRVNKDTPDDLWELAITVNKLVGGLPLFQNDEQIIPGLQRELGFTLHDARDYAIIGCQEITGQGTDYACANGVIPPNTNLHYSVLLTMAINDGKNPFNGEQYSIHTGFLYDMKSIDEVKQAWYTLANTYLRGVMSYNNICEYVIQHYTPFIGISLFTEGCMRKGLDVTWGGAKYNEYGGTATGLATVADSLTAIRWMCFDNHYCTLRELYDACMDNWVGHEELQAKIINDCPHFGNDDPYADEMMDWVTNAYYEMCKGIYSKRAKIFRAGLYSGSDHVAQGYVTWGTPDGRQNPSPIADGASPCQSRDHNGPTAVLQSSKTYQHNKFMDGMALNIRIHPSALARKDGMDKMRDLTKTYLEEGGMEVQYNVVSTEDMKAAQANPEEYRDLVVRIAGYSAYFVELSRDQQNDIISRTENTL
ncbi:MAG: pyruvate formate lyase family protein, partial [Coriobacteriales bacterium]